MLIDYPKLHLLDQKLPHQVKASSFIPYLTCQHCQDSEYSEDEDGDSDDVYCESENILGRLNIPRPKASPDVSENENTGNGG